MPLATILTTTVIPWVAGEILKTYNDKYVKLFLKDFLFTPEEYSIQLSKIIYKTIEKYEKEFPPSGNFPFYHHRETFAKLSKFMLFENEGTNILKSINYLEIENIEIPSKEQVDHFYTFFIEEIKADPKLKEFYIEENYKAKIFETYKEVSSIKNTIEAFVASSTQKDSITKKWIEQIYQNLYKLKYLTALEEINNFEKEIFSKVQISSENKALVFFVKGCCLNENGKALEALSYFEQSSILDPENPTYKAWYYYIKYIFEYSNELIQLVKTELVSNPFDPFLNTIITIEALKKDTVFHHLNIAATVVKSLRFKRNIYRYYIFNNHLDSALNLFKRDKTDIAPLLINVSIENSSYLEFYIQLFFIQLMSDYSFRFFFNINNQLQKSQELETCIGYFETYLAQIKNSEKSEAIILFQYLLEIALFLKTASKSHLDNALVFFNQNNKIFSGYYFNFLRYGYSQIGEFEKALQIFDEQEVSSEDKYFKSLLYLRLDKKSESKKLLTDFVLTTTKINSHNIALILESVLNEDFTFSELEHFYSKLSRNEISTDGIYRDILIATKGIKDGKYKDESIQILDDNFKLISEQSFHITPIVNSYCRVLHSYKIWHKIIDLLENSKLETFESNTLFIDALWFSKQNQTRLLDLLENYRKSEFPPIPDCYIREIKLNQLLSAWAKVEEISLLGKRIFADRFEFNYYLALSFKQQNKKLEFCSLLKEMDILNFQLDSFQTLINGLLQFKEFTLAIDYAYENAILRNEADDKMFFFNVYIATFDQIELSVPLICEKEYFVLIENPTIKTLVNYNDHKSIFGTLLGKRVGEKFVLSRTLNAVELEYKIIGIQHKYQVLFDKIQMEAESPELTGLPMLSFKHVEGEDIFKQLIELFGKSGDEQRLFADKTFNQYKLNDISFIQLARFLFHDDLLDAYLTTTNSPEISFRVIPNIIFHKRIPNDANTIVCIDLPTVFLFSELIETFNGQSKNFLISIHALEYLQELLKISIAEKGNKLGFNISSMGVVPFVNQDLYYSNKIEILHRCINWIDKHCEVSTSKEKLEFLVHFGKSNNPNSLILAHLDTVALAHENNLSLVSDEKTSFKLLNPIGLIMGSTFYLKTSYKILSDEEIYDFLSKKNYLGIDIPMSRIERVSSALIKKDLHSENILLNFSVNATGNSLIVISAINTIEYILSSDILEEDKSDWIKRIFESLLHNTYTNEFLLKGVVNLIIIGIFKFRLTNIDKHKIILNGLTFVLEKNNVSKDLFE